MHLLQGDIVSISVGAVTIDDAAGTGQVEITANLNDGSSFNGVVDLVKIDSYWYMQQVTHTTNPPS